MTARKVIIIALVQTVPLLLFGALLLDGGQVMKYSVIAASGYWLGITWIFIRGRGLIEKSDEQFVGYGFVCLLAVTVMFRALFTALQYLLLPD